MIRKNHENHWKSEAVIKNGTEEKKMHDANSEFQEHSHQFADGNGGLRHLR